MSELKMLAFRNLLVLVFAAAAAAAPKTTSAPKHDVHWNYDLNSIYGPGRWPEFYPNCGGRTQSPIEIETSGVKVNRSLTDFTYSNYDTTHAGSFLLRNTGHYIQVDIIDSTMFLTGGGMSGNYSLAQFHFHWGRNNNRGSEHLINEESDSIELHLVHWNTNMCQSLSECQRKPGGIVVLAVFVEVDDDDELNLSRELGELTTYFNQILHPGNKTDVPAFPMQSLLPPQRSFYKYQGSLTTPPCSEVVTFTIFKKPIYITGKQAAAFRKTFDESGELMLHTYRPIQPLNGRIVYSAD